MEQVQLKNKETLILREAQIEDAEAALSFMKMVADETANLTFSGEEMNKTVEEEAKFIKSHLDAPNQLMLMGLINGEIAGIINVFSSPKKRLKHIATIGISVQKKHWNKGVGFQLMHGMIRWAKKGKIIRKIDLSVLTQNENAVHLYKKLGFEIEGTRARASFEGGLFYEETLMGMMIDFS